MTGSLIALEWTALGGCILMAAAVAVAFVASLVADLRAPRVLAWEAGGPWYPRTPEAATAPLGTLPAALEEELARMWAILGPERPA